MCKCVCIYTIYISASTPLGEACLIPVNMHWSAVVQRRPPGVSCTMKN